MGGGVREGGGGRAVIGCVSSPKAAAGVGGCKHARATEWAEREGREREVDGWMRAAVVINVFFFLYPTYTVRDTTFMMAWLSVVILSA